MYTNIQQHYNSTINFKILYKNIDILIIFKI